MTTLNIQRTGQSTYVSSASGFSALCVSPKVAEAFARGVNARMAALFRCPCCEVMKSIDESPTGNDGKPTLCEACSIQDAADEEEAKENRKETERQEWRER